MSTVACDVSSVSMQNEILGKLDDTKIKVKGSNVLCEHMDA